MSRSLCWRRRAAGYVSNQQPNFNSAILGAAFASLVIRNRADLAESQYVRSEQRDVVLFGQIPAYGLGSFLGELIVVRIAANPIGEALNLQNEVVAILDLRRQLIE